MKIIYNIADARANLLVRTPLELQEISPGLKLKVREAFGEELTLQEVVGRIVAEVRASGDRALFDYGKRIDGVKLAALEVRPEEIARARSKVGSELLSALELAAQRIKSFHMNCKRQSWVDFAEGGLGQWIRPLGTVGIYVPGGRASYPSTVLMTAIPARVAGVSEIIVATPPGQDGVSPATLVAAELAGVDRVFKIGGAQAIAALAFGTQTVPRVDKICGPGNIFVQLAKRMVYGMVDIDGFYGPTETIILADESANPAICAADLLAQAEHDVLASAILITTSAELATRVNQEVAKQLVELDRQDIITASLENRGGIIVVDDVERAAELINDYAPEHLSLMVKDAWSCAEKMRNAGGIFIGEDSPEVVGDYVAGPSHVMPTGGTARFGSPLTVDDFLKVTSVIAIDGKALRAIGPAAANIAKAEGLDAHARAVNIRLTRRKRKRE
ncbi:MAG: histidinol dehydrogenase [Chloroflexi bacterium]|nr:histidinol dehydrogenase [Chloroflexota bacterium]